MSNIFSYWRWEFVTWDTACCRGRLGKTYGEIQCRVEAIMGVWGVLACRGQTLSCCTTYFRCTLTVDNAIFY